jgi:hypothetical protein
VRFALADLITAKTIAVTGPNTVTTEIKRGDKTSKATKIRFTLDGKLNKIVTLVSAVTSHKIQVPAGSHALLLVAAMGKQRDGQVVVSFEQGAPVKVEEAAPALLAASAAGSDVVNAPLADLSADKPIAIPKGSHLSALAWQLYGNEGYWPALYEVNRARIGDNPNRVEQGTELYLPDTSAAEEIMAWVQAGKKDPPPRKLLDALAIARVVQDATDDEADSSFALAAAKEATRARELAQAKEEAAKREAAAAAEADRLKALARDAEAAKEAQAAKEAAAKKAEAAAREAQAAKEAATKKEKAAADAKGGDTDEAIASQVKTNLRALVESGTIDPRVAKVQILSKRGTRIVVDVTNAKKKGPKREGIALMPLRQGLQLDAAWMPLMSELLHERGKQPIYPPVLQFRAGAKARVRGCVEIACYQEIAAALGAKRMITGRVEREGASRFVTLTLHDLASFNEVARVQRTWGRGAMLDRELGAAIDELLGMKPQLLAQAPTQTKSEPSALAEIVVKPQPQLVYRYRPYAIAFTTVGAVGVAGGIGLLVGNAVARGAFSTALTAYNNSTVRTQAQFDALVAQERVINGLQIWSLVALGVGTAALTTGIVFFIIDGQPADPAVALTPTGNGFSLSGRF